MNTAKHYINGRWLESVGGQAVIGDVLNPATSELAARFCDATANEARAAIAAAREAFEHSSWARSPRVRAEVLLDFASALERRKEEIADVIVAVNGKLRREALGEIMAGVSELKYYAGLARNLFGRILQVEPGCYASLDREPSGVAAIILPWNAPVTLLVRSLAPALAAGCSVVVKPAHQTAVVNNMVLECIAGDSRVPPGILNSVIESGTEVSSHLCESPDVDVISFTGSTRVGKLIAQNTASTLKRLSLELGGKAPAVVFADCDMDATVAGVVAGGMVMAGQQCTAIARVLVEASVYDEFSRRLVQALKNLRPGFGNDPQAGMGCLIDIANRDRIAALVEQAEQSERVLLKGDIPGGELKNGAFISPSLIEVQDLDSPFIQQELFGPLLIIERFTDEQEAVRRSNATRYSLAASVWTRDGLTARRMASQLKFGTVWHNAHNRLFAEAETGGYGDSGYGKLHGIEGLNDFMQTKHFYFETR
ncbi:aldehyde dehydrogenase family protein [Pusillimonas caeni]|uniref:aldehyde dehydrogenase family protein n=1 Tax=Pusillimonas caeni TaxID=1348472 RepID=UPI000E59C31F|nr:aldehyde dehydrogenase family protein [Pusillimonas caeni]TFL15206.1 aldehyde dehydrogenase family protein [Pusillimonas caeni]